MSEKRKLVVSSSPHIRSAVNTRSIMLDVIIALMPAMLVAILMFGLRTLALTCLCSAACVFFEWGYRKVMKKSSNIEDLSAVVTGILIVFCLPSDTPYWITIIAAFFAIVVVKQLYGGIGKNFVNPALAARAFVVASWPAKLSSNIAPLSYDSIFNFSADSITSATAKGGADAVTAATPMASLHSGYLPDESLANIIIGRIGGSIGEISAIALVIGLLYLLIRRVISCRIPLTYILTVAVITFIFPKGNDNLQWMLYQVFSGGLLLGAIFMATDYSTSPVTPKGQIIYGVGCGLLTVFIRYFGSYVEGVSYAILIMNVCVWLIDKYTQPRRFGVTSKKEKSKEVGA